MESQYDTWKNKTDVWLAEVIRQGDSAEASDQAMRILQERFQQRLQSYVAQKLPYDWVEEVVQEVWLGFYRYVKVKEIKQDVPNLLWGIARRKRADAVAKLTAERNIEQNLLPSDELTVEQQSSIDIPIHDLIINKEDRQFIRQIPFTSVLSDCERVLWVLRENYEYPVAIVSRLTGKNSQNIYSSLYNARKRVSKYLKSEDHDVWLANRFDEENLHPQERKPIISLEQFSDLLVPVFSTDELQSLGVTAEAFATNYQVSVALPLLHQSGMLSEVGQLNLVLHHPDRQSKAIVGVDVDEDSILLSPKLTLVLITKRFFEEQLWNLLRDGKSQLDDSNIEQQWVKSGARVKPPNFFINMHSSRRTLDLAHATNGTIMRGGEIVRKWMTEETHYDFKLSLPVAPGAEHLRDRFFAEDELTEDEVSQLFDPVSTAWNWLNEVESSTPDSLRPRPPDQPSV